MVLSISENAGGIALELARILTSVQTEYNWNPRRSLVFCIFSGTTDSCSNSLSSLITRKVIAHVVVQGSQSQSPECFAISGSDIIQSIGVEAANTVQNLGGLKITWIYRNDSQFTLATPHVVFSFGERNATGDRNTRNKTLCKINLAQTLSQTIWRLSECLVVKWDPSYFNKTISTAMEALKNTDFGNITERMQNVIRKLLISVEIWNRKVDTTESTNTLEMRMLNDLSMELSRVLLCSDKEAKSSTNWTAISVLLQNLPSTFIHLNKMLKCYETAVQLLNGWVKI